MKSRKQEMTHDARRGATLETGWWRRVGILCLFLAVTAIASSAKHVPLFTNLANFDGTDGPWVLGNLAQGTDGNLYGVTLFGGANGNGVVFSVTPTGTLAVLHYFCQTDCADGAMPGSGVVLGSDGNFYGTTLCGGAYGFGTVFKITPSGTLTTLHNWCAQPNCADGYDAIAPYAPLVQAIDGNFYGTTSAGGANGSGTVFKITPEGVFTSLYSFCSQPNCADGSLGQAGLVQATDENFYGLTSFGGANGFGTVFKITSDGTLTTLHSFNGADGGNYMQAPLVQAADGNFYGVGGYPNGSVFEITPSGTDTVLYTFCSKSNCADGDGPNGLLQATDGNFYGTTYSGGNNGSNCPSYGCGTVFKITPQGTLTTLHSFDGTDGHGVEGPAQATNGSFYGTTAFGGTNGDGTVFSLDVGLRPFVETVPTGGPVGTPVTILGNDLSDATHVRFDHTEATFVVVSDTEITAIVPAGATTGFVTVNRRGPRLKSNVQFQVLP